MNIQKLFDMQRVLDARILEKHPELKGQDNLFWKVLALQVELGECANEWRGFKKWSNDQEPRVHKLIKVDESNTRETNPLLEEYVDCLHFILSIGLELEFVLPKELQVSSYPEESIADNFMEVSSFISELYWLHYNGACDKEKESTYEALFIHFLALGKTLGFTWEQIEEAYFAKNKVNHERQENNY